MDDFELFEKIKLRARLCAVGILLLALIWITFL
jgi:hypothetical protein